MRHAGALIRSVAPSAIILRRAVGYGTSAISMNTQLSASRSTTAKLSHTFTNIAVGSRRLYTNVSSSITIASFSSTLLDDLVPIIAHGNASDESLTVCLWQVRCLDAWKNPSAVRAEKRISGRRSTATCSRNARAIALPLAGRAT